MLWFEAKSDIMLDLVGLVKHTWNYWLPEPAIYKLGMCMDDTSIDHIITNSYCVGGGGDRARIEG